MNIVAAIIAIQLGLVVAVAIHLRLQTMAAEQAQIDAHGVSATGTVTANRTTGRYGSHRRITVVTDGGTSFSQSMNSGDAHRLGLTEGARVAVRHVPDQPRLGRVQNAPRFNPPRHVAAWVGLATTVLGLLCAVRLGG